MRISKQVRSTITCRGFMFCMPLVFLVGLKEDVLSQANMQIRKEEVRHFTTGNGIEFGLWGGNGERTPAPLLFILASTIDETLGTEYFRQCGNRLAREHGWLCVSLDLPYHGKLQKDTTELPLAGWASAARRKEDFVAANNKRMQDILDFLVSKGYADAKNIFACGSSRGGYLALQFASAEHRVRSVAAFSPVPDLLALREFTGIERNTLLKSFSFDNHLDSLATKDIWIVIGDRDERVGTDLAIELTRKISRAGRIINSPNKVELNVMWEPKGHTTPTGSVDRAADWLFERVIKND